MNRNILLSPAFFCAFLLSTSINAQTTTTTTTTNPDGSVTTQETTTQEPAPAPAPTSTAPKALGPKGVAGTLRRVERRDDYRKEQDLEKLDDALEDRPRSRR
jgi:hypothetical protein